MVSEKNNNKVGILGGMGPEATVLLMARIIDLTDVKDDSDHVPLIVDSNTKVPSRIKALIEKTGKSPGPILVEMAKGLEKSGAKALAMPCNTAHYYAEMIKESVDIPLLNMIELTAKEISKQKLPSNKVGILASPAVEITRLFDDALSSYKIEALYPSKQSQMLKVIRSIKENNKGNGVCEIINSAATELNEKGADIILIACSELSLVLDCLQSSYVVIDSMDVLSKAVINFSNNGRQFNLK